MLDQELKQIVAAQNDIEQHYHITQAIKQLEKLKKDIEKRLMDKNGEKASESSIRIRQGDFEGLITFTKETRVMDTAKWKKENPGQYDAIFQAYNKKRAASARFKSIKLFATRSSRENTRIEITIRARCAASQN